MIKIHISYLNTKILFQLTLLYRKPTKANRNITNLFIIYDISLIAS